MLFLFTLDKPNNPDGWKSALVCASSVKAARKLVEQHALVEHDSSASHWKDADVVDIDPSTFGVLVVSKEAPIDVE